MTDTPRWDLAAAETAVASLDLAREVGAAVGVPAVVLNPSPTDPDDRWDAVLGRLAPLALVTVAERGRADIALRVDVAARRQKEPGEFHRFARGVHRQIV